MLCNGVRTDEHIDEEDPGQLFISSVRDCVCPSVSHSEVRGRTEEHDDEEDPGHLFISSDRDSVCQSVSHSEAGGRTKEHDDEEDPGGPHIHGSANVAVLHFLLVQLLW